METPLPFPGDDSYIQWKIINHITKSLQPSEIATRKPQNASLQVHLSNCCPRHSLALIDYLSTYALSDAEQGTALNSTTDHVIPCRWEPGLPWPPNGGRGEPAVGVVTCLWGQKPYRCCAQGLQSRDLCEGLASRGGFDVHSVFILRLCEMG